MRQNSCPKARSERKDLERALLTPQRLDRPNSSSTTIRDRNQRDWETDDGAGTPGVKDDRFGEVRFGIGVGSDPTWAWPPSNLFPPKWDIRPRPRFRRRQYSGRGNNTMAKHSASVIPIRQDIPRSQTDREVVDLAYDLWLARGFRGGSPEEDLLTAVREVKGKTFGGDAA